jgi:small multidrug resistance pump
MAVNEYLFLLLASVIIASVSQILLKKSAKLEHPSFIKEYLNWHAMAGYCLLGLSTILTVLAFRGMEYKNGPILESLGFILVPLLSVWLLKEKLTRLGVAGYVVIIIGVMVFYS